MDASYDIMTEVVDDSDKKKRKTEKHFPKNSLFSGFPFRLVAIKTKIPLGTSYSILFYFTKLFTKCYVQVQLGSI